MKNKKGFTLIELLAVIVVLAIIALIATPIVMNTIKNAKKGAAERSADNYVKAVEQKVAESRIDGTKISDGIYNIKPDGNLCPASGCGKNDKDKITIEMSGNKPTSGTVTISNGGVSQDKSNVKIGNYIVSYDKDNNKQMAQELYKGILCKAVTTATTGNVPEGKFAYGDEYTCELGDNDTKTFFVLETNGDDVSLIMNANVGKDGKTVTSDSTDKGLIPAVSKEDYIAAGGEDLSNDNGSCQYDDYGCTDNRYGTITLEKNLKIYTKTWTKLVSIQITPPKAKQIATASGEIFDDSTSYVEELPTWLYDYLDGTTNAVSRVQGYWTSTPSRDVDAWTVDGRGWLVSSNYGGVYYSSDYGIRPVITILKSNLS